MLGFCSISLGLAPRLLLDAARVVAIYMLVRLVVITVFYLAGLVKIRGAEKYATSSHLQDLSTPERTHFDQVHHLVVIPNFAEPANILSRTLQSLAVQAGATRNITVVLGMEEREPNAGDKAEALLALHRGSFFSMLATLHPAGLPGEAPGKATNLTWAVRCARQELVSGMGIPLSQIVVTVVDSDAIVHPHYFAKLARQFLTDPRRHSLVWQPPILLDNDIWKTSPVIRLITYFSNAIFLGDYFNPWEAKFPYSSYSISLALLDEANYWDPTAMAEDVNIFMRAFFVKGGKVSIQQIHLPIHENPVYGANLWQAIGIFFIQKVRQGWGGSEIGYLVQMWNHPPRAAFFDKLGRLLKQVHDHLFFSTAGFVVALGTLLSIMIDHSAVITLPQTAFIPGFFIVLNYLGGFALLVTWFTERSRLARGWQDWTLKSLLGEIASWVVFPVLFFLLMNLPGLLAQTRMLLGQSLSFKRTPKTFDSRMGD